MNFAQQKKLHLKLQSVVMEENGVRRYATGYSDRIVGEELGISQAAVRRFRSQNFGKVRRSGSRGIPAPRLKSAKIIGALKKIQTTLDTLTAEMAIQRQAIKDIAGFVRDIENAKRKHERRFEVNKGSNRSLENDLRVGS